MYLIFSISMIVNLILFLLCRMYRDRYLDLLAKQPHPKKKQTTKTSAQSQEIKKRTYYDKMPYGEIALIGVIKNLLKKAAFKEFVFYHQVDYYLVDSSESKPIHRQADFLVVSPGCVFILDSKYWKGTTFFYNDMDNLFANTIFSEIGYSSPKSNARVFNARVLETDPMDDSKIKSMVLHNFDHPLYQIQRYNFELSNLLHIPIIQNAIVFHQDAKSESLVVVNEDADISIKQISQYSSIITHKNLGMFLLEHQQYIDEFDPEDVIAQIEYSEAFQYRNVYKRK